MNSGNSYSVQIIMIGLWVHKNAPANPQPFILVEDFPTTLFTLFVPKVNSVANLKSFHFPAQ